MCRSSRSRGLITMQELIVAAPLFLLLIVLLYTQLAQSSRHSLQLSNQAQLQEAGLVLLQRLEMDIAPAPPAGIAWRNTDFGQPLTILSIHRRAGLDPNGLPTFEPRLVIYVWDSIHGIVLRREWEGSFGSSGITLDPLEACRPNDTQLVALALDVGARERQVGSNVTRFEIGSAAPDGFVGNPFTVRLTLSRQVVANLHHDDEDRFEVERSILLRNP